MLTIITILLALIFLMMFLNFFGKEIAILALAGFIGYQPNINPWVVLFVGGFIVVGIMLWSNSKQPIPTKPTT